MSISKDEIRQIARGGDLVKAKEEARKLVEEHPDDIEAQVMLGRYLALQEEYDEALEILLKASEQEPGREDIVYLIAVSYQLREKYEEALYYFRRIAKSPEFGSIANYQMGMMYMNYGTPALHDPQQARRCFIAAATGDKPVEEAFLQLAAIESEKRRVYVLRNGLNVFPKSAAIHTELARLYVLMLGEYSRCIELVDQAAEKGIESDRLRFYSALAHFHIGDFDKALTLIEELEEIDYETGFQYELKCIDALLRMESGHYAEAETLLAQVLAMDFENKLEFSAHFLAMCCALRQGDVDKAERLFEEVTEHEPPFFFPSGWLSLYLFPIEKYFLEALGGVIQKGCGQHITAKAHGLRAIYLHRFRDSDWEMIKEDVIPALRYYPDHSKYHFLMGEVYRISGQLKEAIVHYVQEQLYLDDTAESEFWEYESLLEEIYDDAESFEELLQELDALMSGPATDVWGAKDHLAEYFLQPWVTFLHSRSDYPRVVKVCEWFKYNHLLSAHVLFELAYAYAEIGKYRRSMSMYEAYLRDIGDTSAVRNNLGLLYEREGAHEKAADSFSKAIELDPQNEKPEKNLRRVQKLIQEAEKQKKAYERAVHLYAHETKMVKQAIVKLYENSIEDGLILCRPEDVAALLNLQLAQAKERIEQFVAKKYFDRVEDSGLAFAGYVLRLNASLLPQVEAELAQMQRQEYVEQLALELTPENLEQKYEYGQSLIFRLSVLSSPELVALLERDLREAVTALATQSYKSALILCGSIVEAILMDRLSARESSAVKSFERLRQASTVREKSNQIQNWSLSTLLEVAREENLVSLNLCHWGHGIRGFRNLVHPAVEQRKEVEVSRENAEVAWSVVKRLLKEIS